MTRIEELEKEIALTKELIDLRTKLSKLPAATGSQVKINSFPDYTKKTSEWVLSNVPNYHLGAYNIPATITNYSAGVTNTTTSATSQWPSAEDMWKDVEKPFYKEGTCTSK